MSNAQDTSSLVKANIRPAGHTQIANELLEAITMHAFKQTTLRVLLALVRKTIGFNKKEDDLSASQLGSLLGQMKRQHITTALNELAAMRVIHKRPGRYGSVVGINTDFSQWLSRPASGQESESGISVGPRIGQDGSPDAGHTKDNLPKDNQQNESADAASCGEQSVKLALVPTPPPVIALPVKDGSEFEITEDLVAEWSAAYPGVDVRGELAKARVWLRASPQNLKTRRGMGKFVVGWLGRSAKPAPGFSSARKSAHGNFSLQDYHAGVAADGTF